MLIGNVVILSATKGERLCCISIMTECQTLGHDPMQQEMLRRPGACLCRARQTGPPLDDSLCRRVTDIFRQGLSQSMSF